MNEIQKYISGILTIGEDPFDHSDDSTTNNKTADNTISAAIVAQSEQILAESDLISNISTSGQTLLGLEHQLQSQLSSTPTKSANNNPSSMEAINSSHKGNRDRILTLSPPPRVPNLIKDRQAVIRSLRPSYRNLVKEKKPTLGRSLDFTVRSDNNFDLDRCLSACSIRPRDLVMNSIRSGNDTQLVRTFGSELFNRLQLAAATYKSEVKEAKNMILPRVKVTKVPSGISDNELLKHCTSQSTTRWFLLTPFLVYHDGPYRCANVMICHD